MTRDLPPASLLNRRLDRLSLSLDLAHGFATLGSFAGGLAASVVVVACVDRWLVTIPAAWGGIGGLLIAACSSGLTGRLLRSHRAGPTRLAICRQLERGFPEVGERISRAVGLKAPPRAVVPAAQTRSLQRSLREAALADAAQALDSLPLRRWLRQQPEVWAAAISLLVAGVGWAGLAWLLVEGPAGWHDAIAKQFKEPPTGSVGDPATIGEPPVRRTLPEATLDLYWRVVQLRNGWQQVAAASVDEAGRLAREADEAGRLASDAGGPAAILSQLASGLGRAAAKAAAGASRDEVAEELSRLVETAEAAAGLAEAAASLPVAEQLLVDAAAESAGLTHDELGMPGRSWRSGVANDLRAVAAGITADHSLLVREGVLPAADLLLLTGGDLAAALNDNRLFVASQQLSGAIRALSAITATLGMPPLSGPTAGSMAAVARHRLAVLAQPLATADEPAGPASQSPLTDAADTSTESEQAATAIRAASGGADVTSSAATASTAGEGGQSTASPAAALSAAAVSSPPDAAPQNGSVWVPKTSGPGEMPRRSPPAARDHAATPGYYRRLLNQASQTDRCDAAINAVAAAAVSWSLTLIAAVATDDSSQSPLADCGTRLPPQDAATGDPPKPRRFGASLESEKAMDGFSHVQPEAPDAGDASAAVERGVAWLVSAQRPDGSWGSQRFSGSVAVTAHGLLALASTGSTGLAGPHAAASERAIGFLIGRAGSDGLIAGNEASANGPMYGHAFAVQALAELSGEAARPEITDTLRRACRLIEQTQNDEGGWRYQPRRADADISVTAAMVVALEAAAAAGLAVSDQTIDQAVGYLRRLQNADGGFRYQAAAGPSAAARTAAALVAICLSSPDAVEVLAAGRGWLLRHPISPDPADGYAAYGILASSAATWQAGPDAWARWYAATAADLLATKRSDGAWPDPSCPEYGTAAAILSLTTANGLLPGWKRGTSP